MLTDAKGGAETRRTRRLSGASSRGAVPPQTAIAPWYAAPLALGDAKRHWQPSLQRRAFSLEQQS
jgi:hypothetical protein